MGGFDSQYGVSISGCITPSDGVIDVYSTHDSWYGLGGYREVADLTERDGITTERRKEGMLVYVIATDTVYQLKGGITNSEWDIFTGGGGGSASSFDIETEDGLTTISTFDTIKFPNGTVTDNGDGSVSINTGGVADASTVLYDPTTSGLTATDIQSAVDEIESRIDTLETTAGGSLTVDEGDTGSVSVPSVTRISFNPQSVIDYGNGEVEINYTSVLNLNDLKDVFASTPNHNDILAYDSGSQTWYSTAVPSAPAPVTQTESIDILTDDQTVVITTLDLYAAQTISVKVNGYADETWTVTGQYELTFSIPFWYMDWVDITITI